LLQTYTGSVPANYAKLFLYVIITKHGEGVNILRYNIDTEQEGYIKMGFKGRVTALGTQFAIPASLSEVPEENLDLYLLTPLTFAVHQSS
jgi:hypothetical protein